MTGKWSFASNDILSMAFLLFDGQLFIFLSVNGIWEKRLQHFILYKHRGFLEHWNSQKSVCNIWQGFSCLLDEGIPKIWKKLNFHHGFLSYLQSSTANSAHLAAHFCPAKCYKHFFGYFNALKTHGVSILTGSVNTIWREFFISYLFWWILTKDTIHIYKKTWLTFQNWVSYLSPKPNSKEVFVNQVPKQ